MKLLLGVLFFAASSYGVLNSTGTGKVATVVSGTNNIPTAYSTAAGSAILSSLAYKGHITVQNGTGSAIAVSYSTGACASGNADEMYVLANTSNTKDFANVQSVVCIRSVTGSAISSGSVYAEVW